MVLLGRIFYIAETDYTKVSSRQSTRTLTVGEKRGEIYDRNYSPLVNTDQKLLAVVTPCPGSYEYLKGKIDDGYIRDKIENSSPFVVEVAEEINNELIRTFTVTERYSEDQLAIHLIGYTDSTGKVGVTGIEKAFNNYLSENSGKLSVSFQVDAIGRVLAGMDKFIDDNNFSSKAGVVLTIDKRIQKIAEDALENSRIKSGAVVVMKAHSGEISALASIPEYDPNNVADSLFTENSPFVNKALTSYSVGSIFKPIVAAVALENGISPDFKYKCQGEITVGDKVFRCYDNKKHGKVDMTKALSVSCNTYFINLISNIDTDYLLKLCKDMGLGKEILLAPYIKSSSGSLPSNESLTLKGNLANLAFGQGELLASPLQIASVYHALSTGNVITSKLIMGFTNYMGLMTKEPDSSPIKVLSDSTVIKLREMLSTVSENSESRSSIVNTAGKTGTAQSGNFKDNKEILRTWFAGFFPAENPDYIVVVINEDGVGGNVDCAPVYRAIAEGISGR